MKKTWLFLLFAVPALAQSPVIGNVSSIVPGTNVTCTPSAGGKCSGDVTVNASGGSGSGTVNTGTAGQIAYYAANGTTVSPAAPSVFGTGFYASSGLRSFGDSNTSGFGAVANSGTYAGPQCASNAALCSYVAIMAPAFGSSQTSGTQSLGAGPNYGKAGAFAEDETYIMMKNIAPQHYYNGQTWTAMIGTNNSGTTAGLQTNFTLANTAGYVYASTPLEDMIFPGTNTASVSTTGSWTQDSSFQTNMGLSTQANGATMTFTTFIASKSIVIAINGANSNTSTGALSCDSGALTATLTTAGAATLNFSGGDTFTALGYLETFANSATHTCTITVTASGGNAFTVQYIAVPPTASQVYSPTTVNLPRGFILGTPYYQNNVSLNATFNTLQNNLYTSLNAAGWTNIGWVDTRACVNSTTDMSSVDYTLANGLTYPASASPGAHMDNQGYEKLAACVINVAQPVAAGAISTLATVNALINSGGAGWSDWSPSWMANVQSGTNLASPTNTTTIGSFISPTTNTYSKITYEVYAADNTSNIYNIGWYDSTGALLCQVGATAGTTFAPATGFITLSMSSSCSFVAGKRYYLALTGNASTMKYYCPAGAVYAYRVAAATGGTTANGVFATPLTIGADSYENVNPMPWVSMHN